MKYLGTLAQPVWHLKLPWLSALAFITSEQS